MSSCAACSSSAYTSRIAALLPTRLWNEYAPSELAPQRLRPASLSRLRSSARATTSAASSGSNGFCEVVVRALLHGRAPRPATVA